MDWLETSTDESGDSDITPIADIMSGLMVVFLLVSVAYMAKVRSISGNFSDRKLTWYKDLNKEFKNELLQWNAEIDQKTMSVRFKDPEVLFEKGKSELNSKFLKILNEFFPRYLKILYSKKYKNQVQEIRIEGHTSSEGIRGENFETAYLSNMKLSQDRARSVLGYSLSLIEGTSEKTWLRSRLTANGLSSSNLILTKKGVENPVLSRRVEFRVRLYSGDAS